MSSSDQPPPPSIPVLIDRLVSASLASDAASSLQGLIDAVKRSNTTARTEGAGGTPSDEALAVAGSVECMTALCTLIGSSCIERDGGAGGSKLEVEDGPGLGCELLLAVLGGPTATTATTTTAAASVGSSASSSAQRAKAKLTKALLTVPSETALINALLDCLCPAADSAEATATMASSYARIQSMTVLRLLLTLAPGSTQTQLLSAPDGLNRLIGLLSPSPSTPDEIRNEAILLATDLARTSSSCARLIIFSEGYDRALSIASDPSSGGGEDGLRGGNIAIVEDCVRLCLELTKSDEMGAEVVLGSAGLLDRVARLLELRDGRRYRHPETEAASGTDTVSGGAKGGAGAGAGAGAGGDTDDDDLDDILKTGTARAPSQPKKVVVPYLTEAEESCVALVLDFIHTVLGANNDENEQEEEEQDQGEAIQSKRQSRQRSLTSHPLLPNLLLDLALFAHPPPGAPYPHSVPSLKLQCRALEVACRLGRGATKEVLDELWNKRGVYLRGVGVLERVMYLVCTGGGLVGRNDSAALSAPNALSNLNGAAEDAGESSAMMLSQHALSVLRAYLSSEKSSLMVLHALAPPPVDEELPPGVPPPVPEVVKLVNTLAENLNLLSRLPAPAAPKVSTPSVKEMAAKFEGGAAAADGGDGQSQQSLQSDEEEAKARSIHRSRLLVCATGASSALSVFLTASNQREASATVREMLLKVPVPPPPPLNDASAQALSEHEHHHEDQQHHAGNLVDAVLRYLEVTSDASSNDGAGGGGGYDPSLAATLLRLLASWVPTAPSVLNAVLSSPSSVVLGMYLRSPPRGPKSIGGGGNDNGDRRTVRAMTGLLLGLCMEDLKPDQDVGGWSRAGVLMLISTGMGVAKFTSLLELVKRESSRAAPAGAAAAMATAAPWLWCPSERVAFVRWYGREVRVVRRRAVQELTLSGGGGGGGPDDLDVDAHDDGGESDLASGAAAGRDARSLAGVLAQQSAELEDLRERLSESERTSAAQARQLSQWKRRIESNPTQLDTMIDELTERNDELVRARDKMEAEMVAIREEYEAKLKAKDDELASLREDLRLSREEADALVAERETLRSDMEGLSAAYHGLEGEYNRLLTTESQRHNGGGEQQQQASGDGTAAGEDGGGEEGQQQRRQLTQAGDETTERAHAGDASAEEHSGGAAATGISATAAAQLRAENSQLRADVRAANDWMAMAVSRMDELGRRNGELEGEVASLREQGRSGEQDAAAQPQTHPEQEQPTTSSADNAAAAEADALREQLERERAEWEGASAALRAEVEEARAEGSRLREELDGSKKKEQEGGQQGETSAAAATSAATGDSTEEVSALKDEIEGLRTASVAAQEWMANAVQHHEALAREIQSLSGRNAELSAELVALRSSSSSSGGDTGEGGDGGGGGVGAGDELAKQPDNKVDAGTVRSLEGELSSRQEQIQRLQIELDEARSGAHDEVTRLASALKSRNLEVAELRDELEGIMREKDAEIDKRDSVIEDMERRIRDIATSQEQQVVAPNDEQDAEVTKLRAEISQLQAASVAAQEWMANAVQHHEKLTVEKNELSAKLDAFMASSVGEDETDGLKAQIGVLEAQLEEARATSDLSAVASDEVESLKAENRALSTERDGTLSTIEDMRNRITEFQAWTETAQQRIAELEAENESLAEAAERARADLSEEEETVAGEVADLRAAREALSNERSEHLSTIEDLRSRLNEMQAWTETAQQSIAELERGKEAAETTISELRAAAESTGDAAVQLDELQKQVESKSNRVDELETEVFEKDSALADAQGDLATLRQEIADLNSQSEDAVRQWQERTEELQGTVSSLEAQIETEQEEAEQAIAQWEERCSELRAAADSACAVVDSSVQLGELQKELENKSKRIDELETELFEKDSALTDVQGDLATVRQEIADLNSQSEDAVRQWQERAEELEGTVSSLGAQMETEQEEAEQAIAQWEERCSFLEAESSSYEETQQKLRSAEEEVAFLRSELKSKEESLENMQRKLQSLATETATAVADQLDAEISELRSKLSDLETENGNLKGRNNALLQDVKVLEIQNNELTAKVDQLNVLQSEIETNSVRISELEAQLFDKESALTDSEGELAALQQEIADLGGQSEDAVRQWQERTEELERTVANLEAQMETQQADAEEAIAQWEDRCSTLETEGLSQKEIQLKLTSVEAEVASLREELQSKEKSLAEVQQNLVSLDGQVTSMQADLANEKEMAQEQQHLIDSLQAGIKEREAAVEQLTKELVETGEQSENVVNQWRERAEELEFTVNELESSIDEQQAEANSVIAQWEARCTELADLVEELEKREADNGALLTAKIGLLEEAEAKKQAALEETGTKIVSMQIEIDEYQRKVQVAVEEKAEMEKTLKEVSSTLAAKGDELNASEESQKELEIRASELMEKIADAQTHTTEIQEKLERAKQTEARTKELMESEKLSWEAEARALRERADISKMPLLENMVEELKSSKAQAEKVLEDERRQSQEQTREWDDEMRALEEEKVAAEDENKEMKAYIQQLQEELQDALDSLQPRVTDDVSAKATEMATQALRMQMLELRSQQGSDQEVLANERCLREAAEREVRRLRSILGSEGESDHELDARIRQLTVQMTDDELQKEREELEGLRKALQRVNDELTAARNSSRAAEENAANSRIHASVCEQEARAAKSDLAAMKHAMEEMCESEMAARASLEHRIGCLEDDRELLMHAHADEIDSLKAEIVQMNMDKERLSHLLSESEKANSALVLSTSLPTEPEDDTSERAEIARLRLEKAQLLAAASEVGSRTERRIREAVAAAASSIEAELILERDLRKAAEKVSDDLQAQIDELKSRRVLAETTGAENIRKLVTEAEGGYSDENENQRLLAESSKLKTEIRDLKLKMEEADAEAKATITKLTEKCCIAETKSREIQREGRFEVAVAAEISRLRTETLRMETNGGQDSNELVPRGHTMTGEEVLDFVLELKGAIKEERQLYHQLLAEHDDLLGLVAQQDLEVTSLHEALARSSGQGAVSEAMKEAEQRAIDRFGKYVRVR